MGHALLFEDPSIAICYYDSTVYLSFKYGEAQAGVQNRSKWTDNECFGKCDNSHYFSFELVATPLLFKCFALPRHCAFILSSRFQSDKKTNYYLCLKS